MPASPFQELLAAAEDRQLPPVSEWQPSRHGEIDIRIAANGDWYHEGGLIRRLAIVRLFATILRVEEGGYYLVTPVEKLRIQVDDAPFVATNMETEGEGEARRVLFTTNVGDAVLASAAHPIVVVDRNGEPRPYIAVRDGLDALIVRAVFYRLVECATTGDDGEVSVWSEGERFVLGRT